MGTGVSSRLPADATSIFCAQLFHRADRDAWRRSVVFLRQRSTSFRYPESRGSVWHGDVLVVPIVSPVRRLRLRNLARRSVSYLHARSVFLAVVLRCSDLWDRVLNRKKLTIYRIEAVLY